MSDEHFCGLVCLGAKRMGMGLRHTGVSYEFLDPMTRVVIKGDSNGDTKLALKSACENLVKYLNA